MNSEDIDYLKNIYANIQDSLESIEQNKNNKKIVEEEKKLLEELFKDWQDTAKFKFDGKLGQDFDTYIKNKKFSIKPESNTITKKFTSEEMEYLEKVFNDIQQSIKDVEKYKKEKKQNLLLDEENWLKLYKEDFKKRTGINFDAKPNEDFNKYFDKKASAESKKVVTKKPEVVEKKKQTKKPTTKTTTKTTTKINVIDSKPKITKLDKRYLTIIKDEIKQTLDILDKSNNYYSKEKTKLTNNLKEYIKEFENTSKTTFNKDKADLLFKDYFKGKEKKYTKSELSYLRSIYNEIRYAIEQLQNFKENSRETLYKNLDDYLREWKSIAGYEFVGKAKMPFKEYLDKNILKANLSKKELIYLKSLYNEIKFAYEQIDKIPYELDTRKQQDILKDLFFQWKEITNENFDYDFEQDFNDYLEENFTITSNKKDNQKEIEELTKPLPFKNEKLFMKTYENLYNIETKKLGKEQKFIFDKYKLKHKNLTKIKNADDLRGIKFGMKSKIKKLEESAKEFEKKSKSDPDFQQRQLYKFRVMIIKKSIEILNKDISIIESLSKVQTPYCGIDINNIKSNQRLGTFEECKKLKELRLYGLKKIDPSLLEQEGGFFFKNKEEYKKSSLQTLDKFGNYPIIKLNIYRTPVNSMLKKFLNIISFGQFSKATSSYDDLFHLALVATIKLNDGSLKNIIIEKNASPNISTSYQTNDKTEIKEIDLNNKSLTVKQLLDNTLKSIGNKRFFIYDAFNRDTESGNCQRFISDILLSNGLLNKDYSNFINQDTKEILSKLGLFKGVLPTVTRGLTDIGNILGFGKGNNNLHAVIIKKSIPLEKAKKIAKDIIKDNNRHFYRITTDSIRFRNIPKTKFKKNSFRTKKINKDISLVYGELI